MAEVVFKTKEPGLIPYPTLIFQHSYLNHRTPIPYVGDKPPERLGDIMARDPEFARCFTDDEYEFFVEFLVASRDTMVATLYGATKPAFLSRSRVPIPGFSVNLYVTLTSPSEHVISFSALIPRGGDLAIPALSIITLSCLCTVQVLLMDLAEELPQFLRDINHLEVAEILPYKP